MNIEEIKRRYERLYSLDGVTIEVLNKIETLLELKLPDDFKQIATFYSGGLIGEISHYSISFEGIQPNIVEETIRLRNSINLPSRFLVIAEPPESLIVMDTDSYRKKTIIWCDAVDVLRLADDAFVIKPDTWKTYSDFFSSLIDNEEEARKEE